MLNGRSERGVQEPDAKTNVLHFKEATIMLIKHSMLKGVSGDRPLRTSQQLFGGLSTRVAMNASRRRMITGTAAALVGSFLAGH